jgi:hypothetical protein
MLDCEERTRILKLTDAAFEQWYAVKDIPGSENRKLAKAAQKKVHNLQRALILHYGKHRCNED